jgi:hypothetical protein
MTLTKHVVEKQAKIVVELFQAENSPNFFN